jgi:hypothetical protein
VADTFLPSKNKVMEQFSGCGGSHQLILKFQSPSTALPLIETAAGTIK